MMERLAMVKVVIHFTLIYFVEWIPSFCIVFPYFSPIWGIYQSKDLLINQI